MKITRVNLLCIERGMTPKLVAKALKIPLRRFSALSCGHEKTPRLRKKIAEFFGVDPREIWSDYEQDRPTEIFVRLQKISERLKKEYHTEKVVLFGSYATGEYTPDSDVDILVIAPTTERFFKRTASVKRLIRDLRNGLPIAPIVLTPEEVEKRKKLGDQFIIETLEKGLTL
jgi:predicted nucleotidyltransferase